MSRTLNGRDMLSTVWAGRRPPKDAVICDDSYFLPSESLITEEIYPKYRQWLTTMKLGKWYHKWDCDNFAEAFKVFANGYYFNVIESNAESIAIGIIHYMSEARAENNIRGAHATNVFFTFDENNILVMKVLEPQNGRIFTLSEQEFNSIWVIYI